MSFKKHIWKGLAVAAAFTLSTGLMVQSAFAAASVLTPSNTTIGLFTNLATGSGAYTTLNPVVLDASAAGDIPAGAIVINAPAGWAFNPAAVPTVSSSAPGVTAGAIVVAAGSVTINIATGNTGPGQVTFAGWAARPLTNASAQGSLVLNAAYGALPAGASVGIITPSAIGILISTSSPTVASDGTTSATLTFLVKDLNNVSLPNIVVSVTTSRGTLSVTSSTTSSSQCGTGAAGTSCTLTFRGNGTVGTANITATTAAPNSATATFQMQVVSNSTSPTAVKFLTVTNSGHVAANTQSVYTSPTVATRVRFQVTNSNGDGVNGQLIQATVDKGYISAGDSSTPLPGACNGTNVSDSQTSQGIVIDGTNTDGVVQFTVCAKTGQVGPTKVTAKNLSTTMADASTTVTAAGAPNKLETTVTGSSVTATVKDKDGNEVADGTVIVFSVPSFTGTVSPECTTTTNGKATAAAAFSGAGGQVLVTVFINDSGSGAATTCNGTNPQNGNSAVASTVVNVGAVSGGGGTATGGGFTGAAPAKGSIGLLVTNQASGAAGLVSALAAAGCTVESLAVLEGGVWKIYINGAPAVVNSAFPGTVGATVAFFVRCAA